MPRTHQFSKEQYKQVTDLLTKTKVASLQRKLQVLQLRMEGYTNAEIAQITKYSKSRVSALVCIYANDGITYFEREQRRGGNRRNLTFEEEKTLLSTFENLARKGQLVTVADIASAYEQKVGHQIGGGQMYRVLHRHGWRKVMPRSKHPNKASDEAIAASKKLTMPSEMRWEILPQKTSD